MAPGVESSEVLDQKVWVLRVSIHCEGCKKKIRKILSKIHGVSDVTIDAPRKMVTVTGSVDGHALVKRLAKSNKYAVLLAPEIKQPAKSNADAAPEQPKNEIKDKAKPKELQEAATEEKSAAAPATASDAEAPTAAKSDETNSGPSADMAPAPVVESAQGNAETEKKDNKKLETDDKKTADEGAAADKAGGDGEASADGSKKDEKKTQDGESTAARSREVADMYPLPIYTQQPAYVMSYNMANPTASHAYYAPPMPKETQSYTYYTGNSSPPPEFYYVSPTADSSWSSYQQPTHTYGSLFSEEDPNGCVVM